MNEIQMSHRYYGHRLFSPHLRLVHNVHLVCVSRSLFVVIAVMFTHSIKQFIWMMKRKSNAQILSTENSLTQNIVLVLLLAFAIVSRFFHFLEMDDASMVFGIPEKINT